VEFPCVIWHTDEAKIPLQEKLAKLIS